MDPTILAAVRHLNALDEARRVVANSRRESILSALPAAAARLRAECGATEVWLFGSLVEGGFDETSDCDLAVRGVTSHALLHAFGVVSRELPVPCDVVPMERARPELVACIESFGRKI